MKLHRETVKVTVEAVKLHRETVKVTVKVVKLHCETVKDAHFLSLIGIYMHAPHAADACADAFFGLCMVLASMPSGYPLGAS